MGVFRSHSPRACLSLILYCIFVSNVLRDIFHEHMRSLCTALLICFFVKYIYRCVSRSCYESLEKSNYHLKSGCIPTISRYSVLAFSRSDSDTAVFDFVYASCRAIISIFSSKPFLFHCLNHKYLANEIELVL